MIPLRSPKPFSSFTGIEFVNYVRSLRVKRDKKESKSAEDVSIVVKKNRITIRVKRTPKAVTRDEVLKLANEYALQEMDLLELFIKRKIEVKYGNTDIRASSDKQFFDDKRAAKRNAKPRRTGKRKSKSEDKLFESGCTAQLHEESPVHVSEEAQTGNGK